MSKHILFLDMVCPQSYTGQSLKTKPLGGTEATVIRIAEGLKDRGYNVIVAQHCRTKESTVAGVRYIGLKALEKLTPAPHAVVNLRVSWPLAFADKLFPRAIKIQWQHDLELAPSPLLKDLPLLQAVKARVIGVSRTHKTNLIDALRTVVHQPEYTVGFIYNPIDPALKPSLAPVDENKFIFMSSPHKGLKHVLKQFEAMQFYYPTAKLYVADPGYWPHKEALDKPWVVKLGSLPHKKVIEELRTSFALFYPNPDWFTRETYGLVAAEANAVGTPCLVHSIGAFPEILKNQPDQFVDARNAEEIVKRVEKWRKYGRPQVSLSPLTRTPQVLDAWETILR